jgi:hypothetical protein
MSAQIIKIVSKWKFTTTYTIELDLISEWYIVTLLKVHSQLGLLLGWDNGRCTIEDTKSQTAKEAFVKAYNMILLASPNSQIEKIELNNENHITIGEIKEIEKNDNVVIVVAAD